MAVEPSGSVTLPSSNQLLLLPPVLCPNRERQFDRSRTMALDSPPVKKQSRWRLNSLSEGSCFYGLSTSHRGLHDADGCSSGRRACGHHVAPDNRPHSAPFLPLSDSYPTLFPIPYDGCSYYEIEIKNPIQHRLGNRNGSFAKSCYHTTRQS